MVFRLLTGSNLQISGPGLQAPLDQEIQGIASVTLLHKPIAAGQVPSFEFIQ
jgi:hypothetical protein